MNAKDLRQLKPMFLAFLLEFAGCFPRKDTRAHLSEYLEGQLSDLSRKSVEPIALKVGVPVRTLQEFLSFLRWDEDSVRQRLHQIVARDHAGSNTIGLIDETSVVKKGDKTPGVQRQHCGAVGKQENCVVTVHLGFSVADFHCMLDSELFLPESWSEDRDRCQEAGIPDTMVYRPKSDIALELYERACASGIRFEWLTFDEWYGVKPQFLRALEQKGQKFVGEVHKNYYAWLKAPEITTRPAPGQRSASPKPRLKAGSPKPRPVGRLLKTPALRRQEWERWRIKDGEKGPVVWEVKHTLIYPKNEQGLPDRAYHLIIARNVLRPKEIKYFVSNAPIATPLGRLLWVAFSRWRIERCFEDQKGEVGLDHYEGRRYLGLKRHLILSSLSFLFLAKAHQQLRKKNTGTDCLPSSHCVGGHDPVLVVARVGQSTVVGAGHVGNSIRSTAQRQSPQEPLEENSSPTQTTGDQTHQNQTLPSNAYLAL